MAFKSALAQLESLGDVEERIRKDKQRARMTSVLNARKQFMQVSNSLGSFVKDQKEGDDDLVQWSAGEAAELVGPTSEVSLDLCEMDSTSLFTSLLESSILFDTLYAVSPLDSADRVLGAPRQQGGESLGQRDQRAVVESCPGII